jgi:hypothetical protein
MMMMMMMIVVLVATTTTTSTVSAFQLNHPNAMIRTTATTTTTTKLEMTMNRREMFGIVTTIAAGSLLTPGIAQAFSQQLDDYAYEPSQQATDGRFDLNAAFVSDYKQLRGMFPTAAGKIASNGPYESVKDIYKIPNLTSHDIEMFHKYERQFTVNPPGRTFYERINARVST